MATYRGLIFSLDKKSAVVATPQNAVYKINRTSTMYIGKEITFSDEDIINHTYYMKKYFAAAACFCLIIGIAIGFLLSSSRNFSIIREYAYISMDINPSMEITIDKKQKVIKVEPLNSDAIDILSSEKFKGMKIRDAITKIYDICEDKANLDREKVYVLISGTVNPEVKEHKDNVIIKNILNELKESIQEASNSAADVVALEIEPEARTQAFEYGISPSKYAIFSEIKKNGGEISLEELKNSSAGELVKIYNDVNNGNESTDEVTVTPEPTLEVVDVSATPTPDLTTPTPSVTETPTPIATESPTPVVTKTPNALKTEVPVYIATPTAVLPTMTQAKPTVIVMPTPILTPTPTPKPTPVPKPTATKIAPGTGLRGEYFDNIDLTNFKLTRVDPTIDFYWGTNSPAKEVRDDESYSVRWSGKIRPDFSEEYTFYITRDNGVRLWINNKLIVDKWDNLVGVDDAGKIFLQADKFYDIKLEYFNNCGDGYVKLEWSSKSIGKSVVPKENLYPSEAKNYGSTLPGDGFGLFYEYFDEDNLTNLKEKGVDSVIDFNWGVGSPTKAVSQDHKFSIRWKGFIQVPYDGDYVFYVTYDDGANLWVNDQLLIDKWTANEINTVKSKPIHLKAGQKIPIRLIYRNTNLAGMVRLEWESADIKRSIVPSSCLYPW